MLIAAGVASMIPGGNARPVAGAPDCRVFPRDNVWNERVDGLPVASNSRRMLRSMGLDDTLHPDFGSGRWEGRPIGIPITVVDDSVRKKKIRFRWPSESDKGPYPIDGDTRIEGGRKAKSGDRHAIVVHKEECVLYELFALRKTENGWRAGSGAIFDLSSNALRPQGWTSADAAGLPILPGLVRYNEVAAGKIPHALRFTAAETRRKYIYPARHFASDSNDTSLPPMGLRVRLKKGFDLTAFPKQARVVAVALKRYGMILADNGSDWFISGEPHRKWNNDALRALKDIPGRAFQVVDTSDLRNG